MMACSSSRASVTSLVDYIRHCLALIRRQGGDEHEAPHSFVRRRRNYRSRVGMSRHNHGTSRTFDGSLQGGTIIAERRQRNGGREYAMPALLHPGPALLDVKVNRMELAMPPKIELAQVAGTTLYSLKAILAEEHAT
jgi:hypothetical protein